MPLINCEFNLELTWSRDCVITNSTGEGKFLITETKFYVRVVTLWTQDNGKLLQKLKSDFKRPFPWNKHESSLKTFVQGFKEQTDFLYYLLETEMVEHYNQRIIWQREK